MSRSLARLGAVAVIALVTSGCISVLPKAPPATLYRLDASSPQPGPASAPAARIGVSDGGGSFVAAAAGDRILTYDGDTASYLAGARWVGPAVQLFREASTRAFEAQSGPVRLVARGAPGRATLILRLDVRNFEAVYDQGQKAAPQVVVRVRASLIRGRDQGVAAERLFEAKVRAGDNRVSAIVAAFNAAVGSVLGDAAAWTNETAVAAAPDA